MRQLMASNARKMGVREGATMIRRLFNRWLGKGRLPRELFVHEDDWGQIEVLPATCAAWCESELARIEAFSAAHAAPDGSGWTDIYTRGPAPAALADLRIPFAAATARLAAQLPAFDVVTSGTFSAPQPVPRIRGFGPLASTSAGIVVVPDRSGDIVEMVSLVLDGPQDVCAEVIHAAKQILASSPLIVVDWQQGTVALL